MFVGLDLGGTKLLGVVVDPDDEGPPPIEEKVATPVGSAAVVDAIVDTATRLIARAEHQFGRRVAGVGLGAPGLVDRTGTFHYGPNLPGVIDLQLAAAVAGRLPVPVIVENDATCAAWAEHERGAARGRDHSVLVTLGTGIGGGVTVKGEPLRGVSGFAGEPGHMIVDPDGPLCPCGRRGCWERYASGSGLGRLAREAAEAGRGARMVELAGGLAEDVRGENVTVAAAEGDLDALAVLERFGWWVALGLANLANILDPEIIVIGGGLAEEGDLFLEPTRRAFAELVMGAEHRPEMPIVAARLGERAGAVGAALLSAART